MERPLKLKFLKADLALATDLAGSGRFRCGAKVVLGCCKDDEFAATGASAATTVFLVPFDFRVVSVAIASSLFAHS
jgi:hypothetical protein